MAIYKEYNGINKFISNRLEALVNKRAQDYVEKYATADDGTINTELADRIKFEVQRRGDMSRELDVLEPLRWAGVSSVLAFGLGGAAKHILGEKDIGKIATTGAVTGLASFLVAVARPYFRFEAALYASAQTAIGTYERNDHFAANGQLLTTQAPTMNEAPQQRINEVIPSGSLSDNLKNLTV